MYVCGLTQCISLVHEREVLQFSNGQYPFDSADTGGSPGFVQQVSNAKGSKSKGTANLARPVISSFTTACPSYARLADLYRLAVPRHYPLCCTHGAPLLLGLLVALLPGLLQQDVGVLLRRPKCLLPAAGLVSTHGGGDPDGGPQGRNSDSTALEQSLLVYCWARAPAAAAASSTGRGGCEAARHWRRLAAAHVVQQGWQGWQLQAGTGTALLCSSACAELTTPAVLQRSLWAGPAPSARPLSCCTW